MQAALDYRKEHGTILGFPGTETLPERGDWVGIQCDILVPAALESVITEENAHLVKAKVIGEAANGPITAEAADIIIKKRWCHHSGYVSECRGSDRFIF
ncbi:MAG: hypothetical protein IPP49_12115 [Saprospiraceae bacterium]|nr:hypothetical protein [Saprospiraceae bacterium]